MYFITVFAQNILFFFSNFYCLYGTVPSIVFAQSLTNYSITSAGFEYPSGL